MSFSSWWILAVAASTVILVGGQRAVVAEEPKSDDEVRLRAFREHAAKAAGKYEIRLDDDSKQKLVLREAPILRWTNPVGMRKAKGDVFLWTDRGRAAAVLSIYEMTDPTGAYFYEDRELSSLALSPLVATSNDHGEWRPKQGLSLKPLIEAAPPQDTRPRRLRQMRELAARFTADKTTRQDIVRELRLLPQPVYRFEGEHPDVLDAALFALVEGTDPEAFLLLEARRTDSGHQWQYAFSRMNSVRLRGYDRGAKVWESPRFDGTPGEVDIEAVYAVYRVPAR